MIRTRKRLFMCITLLCVNLAFIWGNSLLPGGISSSISTGVQNLLTTLLPGGSGNSGTGHGTLRKLAHLAEFCTLGMLLCWLFGMVCPAAWKMPAFSLFFGGLVACLDEAIQCLVPDRGPGLKDIGIDTLGVILGIVIIYFIKIIRNQRIWRNKSNEKTDRYPAGSDACHGSGCLQQQ